MNIMNFAITFFMDYHLWKQCGTAGILLFLAAESFPDLYKREICIPWCPPLLLTEVLCRILDMRIIDGEDWQAIWIAICLSILPGICLIALAGLTDGKIGGGDGLVILSIGPYFTFCDLIGFLTLAFGCLSIAAGAGILTGKIEPRTPLPFLPFLLAAFVGILIFS